MRRANMLHVQRNVLKAERRPSDITLEAHGDSAAPVSDEADIRRACESLEVRCPLCHQGEQAQRRRPPPPSPESSMVSGMKYCVAGSTRGAYSFRVASSLALAELPGNRDDRCLLTLQAAPADLHPS